MHDQLRLADRQGLLVGKHLSEVQVRGIQVLMYLADVAEYRDAAQAFKYAVAARPDFDVEKMFPEYFPDKVVEEDSAEVDDSTAYDYEAVEWQGPSDTDQETLNKMLEMLNEATGTVSGTDTLGSDEGKWV